MKHGFIKVLAASPAVSLANPMENAKAAKEAMLNAEKNGAKLLVLPELFLSGYTCGDIFFSKKLINECALALEWLLRETAKCEIMAVIGLPFAYGNALYDCAAVIYCGQVCGIVPKTYLTSAEKRWFSAAPEKNDGVSFCGVETVFGTKQMFTFDNFSAFKLAVEIGYDMQANIPPSAYHAAAGATVIACPAASTLYSDSYYESVDLICTSSNRSICGYVYASAGEGESTTDYVYSAYCAVAEHGVMLDESAEGSSATAATSEIDLELIENARLKNGTFNGDFFEYDVAECELGELTETSLTRYVNAYPFSTCEPYCVLEAQVMGLAKRIKAAYAKKLVIGISGGLDSTLALLVAVKACEKVGMQASDVIAVTMPCFGTSSRTKNNAEIICKELGVTFKEIDIAKAVEQHFEDIGHSIDNHDVTYENSQARERTQILMDIANAVCGIVIGTGDLSEIALGFATYNGDHMSMYAVNASVPKTLMREMIRDIADGYYQTPLCDALLDIVDTPISPELLPPKDGEITQSTEDIVGPYELHDFFIYHTVRLSESPEKIFRLAKIAFKEEYDEKTVAKWLNVFVRRFFSQQFKRSCMPDGPKVTEVSLSPRGGFVMPSDVAADIYKKEAEEILKQLEK